MRFAGGFFEGAAKALVWVAMAVVTVLWLSICGGCGASKLDNSTRALGGARITQTAVVQVLAGQIEADLEEHCGEIATPVERESCARARGEEWRRAEGGVNAGGITLDELSAALLGWALRIQAGQGDADTPPANVCEHLAAASRVAAAWAEFGGLTVPGMWTCAESDQ